MMPAKFKMSKKGVGELLRSDMVKAEMVRRAEVIRDVAASIAPVYAGSWEATPGLYKASFVVSSKTRGGRRKNRATATVTNTTYYARWVEYGTEKVPAHHVMLRAAQAGGR
ncbi:HK97-gp10 family putative phage morphogenesis protein [Streptomyces sp. NBC_01789]|uniref:HK97-gp10 family putative phage morphogenesis protein n=1 Tax=Streptomyces sp. NBC_01789 TaxID=2975941 RepID=UPI0022542D97|nr:HK97-gp10 family putative phage morphogenesis protein [Streptomyces sp. NBC_01789]MCX4450713.1 HK97 gp10 family phage protein [Streptomyces sp. NBC_01789]